MLKRLFEKRREKKVFRILFLGILLGSGISFLGFSGEVSAREKFPLVVEKKYAFFLPQKKETCVSSRFSTKQDLLEECLNMKEKTQSKSEVVLAGKKERMLQPASEVISRTKARPSAPMPASFKKENGRLVCAKKNDKPGKSKKNKKKHMDMECCLDPDEYPNPHCTYSPEKYGKYL